MSEQCLLEGCEKTIHPSKASAGNPTGYCKPHYRRILRASFVRIEAYGLPKRGTYRKVCRGRDYVNIIDSRTGAYIGMEHRLIIEDVLGRPLTDEENIHHKNGIRDDNRMKNLELWSKSQPTGQRVEDKIQWAKEFLALYGVECFDFSSEEHGFSFDTKRSP